MAGRDKMVRAAGAWMAAALFFGSAAHAQSLNFQVIGGGPVGDGGAPGLANLSGATDVEYDAAGNLYISQDTGNRIRRITPTGVVSTVVGGNFGFGGDGGAALSAKTDRPAGIAIDTAGNLYFADQGNRRIRKITPGGLITTVAGNGGKVNTGDGGPAVNAGLASVRGLGIDSFNNLYIADPVGHVVRMVTPGGIITTVAGSGVAGYAGDNGAATSARLNQPYGVDLDAQGNLYIADTGNSAVRRVTVQGTITTAFAPANSFPLSVAVDAAGAVYIGAYRECSLLKWNGSTLVRFAGRANACLIDGDGGAASTAGMGAPDGIAFDAAGNLAFADSDYGRVRRISTGGLITAFAGSGGNVANGAAAVGAPLSDILGIAVASNGEVLISDALTNRRLRTISTAGTIATVAGNGLLTSTGACTASDACPATQRVIAGAWGVAYHDGKRLVADRTADRVYAVDTAGNIATFAGGATASGNGDGGAAAASRLDPYGMATDNAGNLYIADYNNDRVRRVNAGTITTFAGNGGGGFGGDGGPATSARIDGPVAIATDAAGNVYISESGNFRIRKVTPTGVITTIAGNGTAGITGDGGQATAAGIGIVYGIAVDPATGIYIAAEGRLRRIAPNGIIQTVGGMTHAVLALAMRDGRLFAATQDGVVLRANVSGIADHDFDGDGKSDLLWRNTSNGANSVWRAANAATAIAITGVTNQAWKVVGQGDFDGDGKSDILWRNGTSGENTIWRSGNNTTQIAVTRVTTLAWTVAGVGDFDGDGKSDILWRHATNGANSIWRSGNSSQQIAVTGVTNLAWKIVGVGDFDGDAQSDIVWRNTANGQNSVWRSARSTTQIPMTTLADQAWKVAGVGDFDGDGKSDLLWRNSNNGFNGIWKSANSASQLPVANVTNVAWRVAQVADFDGDGRSDIAWRNASNGGNAIWKSANVNTQQSVATVSSQAWGVVPVERQP